LTDRPDPDALLARVQAEEEKERRGKLKIFFGATAGVGKTYTMLEAAHELRRRGVDVLVGWVETHGRKETEALLAQLDVLPPKTVEHRGIALREFDLDGALQRRPAVLLLDELAHSNAPGSRHAKRWQDAQELVAAGVDVWTTLNVQHVESLNDLVAKVTGVAVKETVPDSVVDEADEVELVDLPVDELLQRLAEGKVYVPEQARRALESFFRKGNLIALRELALRRTAERVDEQMLAYRQTHGVAATWPVAERLVVGVGPSPASPRLVRAARRLAARLQAEWLVVHVETAATLRAPVEDRERLQQTLRLAARLGAEVLTVSGERFGDELLRLARERNASKIVVGHPTGRRWWERLRGSQVDALVRSGAGIDVWVVAGEEAQLVEKAAPRVGRRPMARRELLEAAGVVALCTLIAAPLSATLREANLVMLYLLGVVWVAARHSRRASAVAAALAVLAFDFFFVEPRLTFAVADTQYLLTFAVMLLVGLTISTLADRFKRQLAASRAREARTQALYALARDLAAAADLDSLLRAAAERIRDVFLSQVIILLPDPGGRLEARASETITYRLGEREAAVAEWVFAHGQLAGRGTDTLPAALGVYLPLQTARGVLGVLGLHPAEHESLLAPEQLRFLETFASQLALAVERRREPAS
jgi:two-component system sensor histidine kinase KdpD